MNRLRRLAKVAALIGWLAVIAGCASAPGSDSSVAASSAPAGATSDMPAPPAVVPPPAVPPPPAASAEEPAPTPAAVDPLRPEVRLDLDDRSAQLDLWARVRVGFAMPELDNALVRDRERWYATRPDYVQRMTERGSRYLFHIVEEVEKRGMPTELALLPFIESAFNPQAISSAKASGMWQFMPATGRNFELRQNVFRDDRRDVLASTRAALDYLAKLHGMFGDWHLALAAYNWGEGNVQRAIARNRRAGLGTGYESLRMPDETRLYVPKLQAVKNIVARPAAYGLQLPDLANHPYFLAVAIERDIDVELAARLARLPLDEFKALNPQMNRPVILAAGTPQVLLPYDNANHFVRDLPQHRGRLASWTAWVAPKLLRPADAAKQVGMSEEELREVNGIPPHYLVRAGSTLLVPRSDQRHADVSEHLAENATMALAPDGPSMRRVALKAGKRDSVSSVARRYRVSAQQVAQWNGVTAGSSFRPGQPIVVYVVQRTPAAKSVKSTKSAKAAKTRSAAAAHKTTPKAARKAARK
jgi:membrane-bound lytic murein transglycosylase D